MIAEMKNGGCVGFLLLQVFERKPELKLSDVSIVSSPYFICQDHIRVPFFDRKLARLFRVFYHIWSVFVPLHKRQRCRLLPLLLANVSSNLRSF